MKKVSTFAAAFHVETSFLFWRASFERKNFVWPLLSGRMEAALAYVCTMYVQLFHLKFGRYGKNAYLCTVDYQVWQSFF